jgi:hypothetical protein
VGACRRWRATYGPGGTVRVGGGWGLALLGLGLFLRGAEIDPATWEGSPKAKEFAKGSRQAWGSVIQAPWGTSDEEIAPAVAFGVQHFAPRPRRTTTADRRPVQAERPAGRTTWTWRRRARLGMPELLRVQGG